MSSPSKAKQQAYLYSDCGYGRAKTKLVEAFWGTIWPSLEQQSWTKLQGNGNEGGMLFVSPMGGHKFDRIREVIDHVNTTQPDSEAGKVASDFLNLVETLEDDQATPPMRILRPRRNLEPTTTRASPVAQLDLSWKEGGSSFPKRSSRVGEIYQATQFPPAGSFQEDQNQDSSELCEMIWDPTRAKAADALDFAYESAPAKKKEAGMLALHKLDYQKEKLEEELKDHAGLDWSQEERQFFHKEFFQVRKDLSAIARTMNKCVNDCYVYYLGTFKKSDDYRMLKVVCEEERAEKTAASDQGADSCAICGDGGSLLICDGCEGEYHMHCLKPPLASVPEGHWECDDCVGQRFLNVRNNLIRKSRLYVRVDVDNKPTLETDDAGNATKKQKTNNGTSVATASGNSNGNLLLRPSSPVLASVKKLANCISKALAASSVEKRVEATVAAGADATTLTSSLASVQDSSTQAAIEAPEPACADTISNPASSQQNGAKKETALPVSESVASPRASILQDEGKKNEAHSEGNTFQVDMSDSKILQKCLCLVTGASSGIGKATCQVLTTQGAKVIGTGRNVAALEKLKADGDIVDSVVADITKEGECKRIVETAVKMLGGLTTVVNAAGVLQGGAMGSIDMENYHYNMTTNTQAPFEIMMHAIPHLKEQKESNPSIVNVSSVNGKQSFAGCVSYCMSKAAIDQLTRCASVDLAKDGIRVNAVNPGVIETNLQKAGGLSDEQYASFLQRSIETTHPLAASLGRVGTPEEVAELIAFLVSDKAQFLTGECITIDGGRQNLGAR